MIVNYLICVIVSMILGVVLVFWLGSNAPGSGIYKVGQAVYGQDHDYEIIGKYIATAESTSYVPIYTLKKVNSNEIFLVFEDEIENTAE